MITGSSTKVGKLGEDRPSDEFDDTDQQEVVAYLDGELEEELARRLRDKMQSHPTMREEVEEYQETWDLLDLLDAPPADADLKTRTIELAPLEDLATDDWPVTRARLSARERWGWWLAGSVWIVALVGCFLAGLALTYPAAAPAIDHQINQNRALYEEYPLLEKVGSRDFLEKWSATQDQPSTDADDNNSSAP